MRQEWQLCTLLHVDLAPQETDVWPPRLTSLATTSPLMPR
jgi:hypothetical protein